MNRSQSFVCHRAPRRAAGGPPPFGSVASGSFCPLVALLMADQPPVEFGDAAPPPGRVRPTSNLSQARDLDVALFDADADGPREPWLAVKGAEVLFNASRKALRVVLPLMQMSRQVSAVAQPLVDSLLMCPFHWAFCCKLTPDAALCCPTCPGVLL